MKRFFTFLVLMILTSSIVLAAGPEGDPAKDPKGFRSYAWKTDLSTIQSKEKDTFTFTQAIEHQGKTIKYYKSSDGPFEYHFGIYNEKLISGKIVVSGKENFDNSLSVLRKAYGSPTSILTVDMQSWMFPNTIIGSQFDDSTQSGQIVYFMRTPF